MRVSGDLRLMVEVHSDDTLGPNREIGLSLDPRTKEWTDGDRVSSRDVSGCHSLRPSRPVG